MGEGRGDGKGKKGTAEAGGRGGETQGKGKKVANGEVAAQGESPGAKKAKRDGNREGEVNGSSSTGERELYETECQWGETVKS